MSADYLKGRYDELVERHKELLELYKRLEWNALTSKPMSGISGGMVNYHSGLTVNPKLIGGTIGGTGITFSILSYFLGLVPLTFGVSLSACGLLYAILTYVLRDSKEEEKNPYPHMPPSKSTS